MLFEFLDDVHSDDGAEAECEWNSPWTADPHA
jgi:hypothetical protein